MKTPVAVNVDDYIARAPEEARAKLAETRAVIRAAVPQAEEGISWGVPFYKHHGMLGGFSVYRDHVSVGCPVAIRPEVRSVLEEKGYKTGVKTVRIGFEQDVPGAEIGEMLRAQAALNEAKGGAR